MRLKPVFRAVGSQQGPHGPGCSCPPDAAPAPRVAAAKPAPASGAGPALIDLTARVRAQRAAQQPMSLTERFEHLKAQMLAAIPPAK